MKTSPENLQPLMRCPVCNKKYRPAKVLVLDENEQRTTLHLTCEQCQAASLVFVSMGQLGVMSFGMFTDMDQNEARGMFRREAISPDNVIEVHQFLKRHTGGIEELIS